MLTRFLTALSLTITALRSRVMIVLFIASCVGCYVVIALSDTWSGDSLGGAVLGNVPLLKFEHSQSVALLVNSYSDINMTVLLGLFLAAGFSAHRFSAFKKTLPFSLKAAFCLFGSSAILSFFFAARLKSELLIQLQFDKVNVLLLQSTLDLHMLFLLFAVLFSLFLVWRALELCATDLEEER